MAAYNETIIHNARRALRELQERCPQDLEVVDVVLTVESHSNAVDLKRVRLRWTPMDGGLPIDVHIENDA